MKRKVRSKRRAAWEARRARTVCGLAGPDRVRLTVYRSGRHIYAQLVEPLSGRTLASASTRSKEVAAGLSSTANVEAARRVGAAIAGLARRHEVERVVFNRNGFLYHGRVKALAEAAREAGLKF